MVGGFGGGPGARPPGPAAHAPPAKPPWLWAIHHAWVHHHIFGCTTIYFDEKYQFKATQANVDDLK